MIVKANQGIQRRRRPNYRRRRGLGDCTDPNPDTMQCPDGSMYTGGGGGASSSGSGSLTSFFQSIVPASFTTLQEAIAQPGQVIRTPTTLITGAGGSAIPGITSLSTSGLSGLLVPALVIGGLILVLGKK